MLYVAEVEEEEDDGIPLWKKALMKKRAAEQKKKEHDLKVLMKLLPAIFVIHCVGRGGEGEVEGCTSMEKSCS